MAPAIHQICIPHGPSLSSQQSKEKGTVIPPFFQQRQLRHKKVMYLPRGHRSSKWWVRTGPQALSFLKHYVTLNKVQGLPVPYSEVGCCCFKTLERGRLVLSPSSLCPLILYPKVSAEMEKVMHEARVD